MRITLSDTLRVVSHELRAPLAVIQGYARLLGGGQLAEEDRARALAQIQAAAGAIATIAKQADELQPWLGRLDTRRTSLSLSTLVEQAVEAAAIAGTRIVSPADGRDREGTVTALGAGDGLVRAIAIVCVRVGREADGAPITLAVRPGPGTIDLLVGSTAHLAAPDQVDGPDGATARPVPIDVGGLGLSYLVAAAILDAHGARVWKLDGQSALVGIRLPLETP